MSSINNCNLKRLCRLCAEICSRDEHNIFSNGDKCLVDFVEKYLSIKVTINDTLPVHVCEECRIKVVSFNEYAMNCADVQIKLSDLLRGSTENHNTDPFFETMEIDCKIENIKSEFMGQCDTENMKSENYSDSLSDDATPIRKSIISNNRKVHNKIEIASERQQTNQLVSPDPDTNLGNFEFDKSFDKPTKKARSSNSTFIKLICHVCNEEFLIWEKLQNHAKKIHQVKPKILCVCNQYLNNKQKFYQHIKMHDSKSQDRKFAHRCTKCDCSFNTPKNLEKHNLLLHPNSITTPEFKCEHCKKTFTQIHLLKSHAIKHLPAEVKKIHPCELCELKFITKQAVAAHVKGVHHKERPFICDICGITSASKYNLLFHKVTHTNEKPFACQLCPKTFKLNSTLKKHINIHYGKLNFKCSKCPSMFNAHSSLKEHMHVHIDTCRFVCGFCNKGFKWRRSFQSHLNNHTGETPFACPWCPKTFADGSNCRIHKRRKHPKELAEYDSKNETNNYKAVKRIASNVKPVIRCIQFDDNVKPQVFLKN